MIDQLSRLKKELAPCPGLFPAPVSFFPRPLMPLPHSTSLSHSTSHPNISLSSTYPRLPVILSSSSLSPAAPWLETETRNTKKAAEKYVQDVQESNLLTNSTKTNIEDNKVGFRSLCPGLRLRYGTFNNIKGLHILKISFHRYNRFKS